MIADNESYELIKRTHNTQDLPTAFKKNCK